MVELSNGVKFRISDDKTSILSYDKITKCWTHHAMAPQGKTFKDIRMSKTGSNCEFLCDDGRWYDTLGMGKVGLSPINQEQIKIKGAGAKPKKKGSLGWRIIKGIFKCFTWFLAFTIGLQLSDKEKK